MTAFDQAWDVVKAELDEPMVEQIVDVATTGGDECCEKWMWLVDGAECDRLYALLENLAHAHPHARQFLQMWDDCSSGKNTEGME